LAEKAIIQDSLQPWLATGPFHLSSFSRYPKASRSLLAICKISIERKRGGNRQNLFTNTLINDNTPIMPDRNVREQTLKPQIYSS
jgi:hypothetical protein